MLNHFFLVQGQKINDLYALWEHRQEFSLIYAMKNGRLVDFTKIDLQGMNYYVN